MRSISDISDSPSSAHPQPDAYAASTPDRIELMQQATAEIECLVAALRQLVSDKEPDEGDFEMKFVSKCMLIRIRRLNSVVMSLLDNEDDGAEDGDGVTYREMHHEVHDEYPESAEADHAS